MGYAFAMAPCYVCGRMFVFNPLRVPSVRDENGEKQPICKSCIEEANRLRRERGQIPFPIPDDAYKPVNEAELG